jgi:hypothetical protein
MQQVNLAWLVPAITRRLIRIAAAALGSAAAISHKIVAGSKAMAGCTESHAVKGLNHTRYAAAITWHKKLIRRNL